MYLRGMELFGRLVQKSAENLRKLAVDTTFSESFASVVDRIVASYRGGGSLFVAGNGGSAADAQHLVAELVSKLERDRDPIRAFALTVDTSILTAIGNDYGYEYSFERQIDGLMRSDDVFFAISTSGNSKNILQALRRCRKKGVTSVLLTGRSGGVAVKEGLADLTLIVPGETTAMIQEAHTVVYHLLCYQIESQLVEQGLCRYR